MLRASAVDAEDMNAKDWKIVTDRAAWLGQIVEVFRQRRALPVKEELKNQLHAAGDHAAALELLRRLQTPNDRRGPDAPSGNGVGP